MKSVERPILRGLVFTGLWVLLLVQGRKVDAIVAEREAAADEEQPAAAD